jgi:hypothetical protein
MSVNHKTSHLTGGKVYGTNPNDEKKLIFSTLSRSRWAASGKICRIVGKVPQDGGRNLA